MKEIPKPAKRGPKPRRPIRRGKRPARARKRANRGALRELADDLMSLYVRHKAGWVCWVCTSRRYEEMQMAHLYPKGAHPCGRYMEANVRCLCVRCHKYYSDRDAEWTRLLISKLGFEPYETLGKMVDVRTGPQDYKAFALAFYLEVEQMETRWKIEERFRHLEAKALEFDVIRAPSERTWPGDGSAST